MITEAEANKMLGERVALGEAFLSQRDLVLVEDRQGNKQTLGDIMEDMDDLEGLDPLVRSGSGLMMRNLWEHIQNLDETTRTLNIGDWDKFAYPMVTIVYNNLVSHSLVSVQPIDGPVSIVFYLKATYGDAKAPTQAGDDIIASPNKDYGSEHVLGEQIEVGDGGAGPYTGNFAWAPVQPSTITITDGTETFTDDGAGVLTGDAGGSGTIVYSTGAFSVTFNAVVALSTPILADYDVDLEGHAAVPQIDISLQQSPVQARTRKLRSRWSLEGAYNLKKLHGMDAEVELVSASTNEMKFEIDQDNIMSVWDGTSEVEPAWSSSPATGVSYAEHQLEFVKVLNQASNRIFQNSGRAVGEWVVCGVGVSNVIEVLPGYDGTGTLTGRGIYESGVLNGTWRIVKNSYFTSGNYLMGYKGGNMYDTGFIYSPYLLFYTTPTYMLDDFISRKGFATQSGKKMVDANFFCRGSVT